MSCNTTRKCVWVLKYVICTSKRPYYGWKIGNGKAWSFIILYVLFRNGCPMPVPKSRLVISVEVTGTAEDTDSET